MKRKQVIALLMSAAMVGTSVVGCGSVSSDVSEGFEIETGSEEGDELAKSLTAMANVNAGTSTADKQETVYVKTDATGSVNNVIVSEWLKNGENTEELTDVSGLTNITNVKGKEGFSQDGDNLTWAAGGSDIYYQGETDKEIPVSVKISYKLDGEDIAPDDLAGKSGKVTIRFEYENNSKVTAQVGDAEEEIYTPFAVISGMMLPTDTFTNVEVTDGKGKIISDGNNNIVVGMSFPGLLESLGATNDKLEEIEEELEVPDSFEITADATDFELGMTMTVVSSDVLSQLGLDDESIDTSNLDELSDSMEELGDASSQLIDGTGRLADGMNLLQDKTSTMEDGTSQLANGIKAYTDGVGQVATGATQLNDGANQLNAGVGDLQNGVGKLDSGAGELKNGATQLNAGAGALKTGLDSANAGAVQLKNGIDTANAGAGQLMTGSAQVATGATQLKNGITALQSAVNGTLKTNVAALNTGAAQLNAGVSSVGGTISQLQSSSSQLAGAASGVNSAVTAAYGYLQQAISAGGPAPVTVDVPEPAYGTMSAEDVQGSMGIEDPELAQMIADNMNAYYYEAYAEGEAVIACQVNTIPEEGVDPSVAAAYGYLQAIKEGENGDVTGALAEGLTQMSTQLNSQETAASITALTNGAAQLAGGMSQLYAGMYNEDPASGSLSVSVGQLVAGAASLETGAGQVSTGAASLSAGTNQLATGAASLTEGTKQLVAGATQLETGTQQLVAGANALKDGTGQLSSGASTLKEGTEKLVGGTSQLVDGTSQLTANSQALVDGSRELADGAVTLIDGIAQLADGANELNDGMIKFDKEGISKLTDLFDEDIENMIDRLEAVVDAGKNYNSFAGIAEGATGSVNFIIESAGVEK